MKILLAIQGTGNGHLSRARDIYPELCKYGEVDVLVSGIQADVTLPFPVKYQLYGVSFIFGKRGGVDIASTAKKLKLFRFLRDMRHLPVEQYDLVINDFEPVSAWACRLRRVPCISLSHQCAVLHRLAPKPEKGDLVGELVLQRYAPVTAAYGFHFEAFAENIFTPVIRREIREAAVSNQGHYTVYLPAYDDQLLVKHLSVFKDVKWEVFTKHSQQAYSFQNIQVTPIENNTFIKSMAASEGVLCGAGFEGPAEALYLGKKLLCIPMNGQYEQHCNAAGLKRLGVPIIHQLHKKHYNDISLWLNNPQHIAVHFPDLTGEIVSRLIKEHAPSTLQTLPGGLGPDNGPGIPAAS
ncbi:MAG: glycosyl transferase [Flavipsychrobacter sp.]|nr:glycosyl transferase [Flavipsychrobacter sp.]